DVPELRCRNEDPVRQTEARHRPRTSPLDWKIVFQSLRQVGLGAHQRRYIRTTYIYSRSPDEHTRAAAAFQERYRSGLRPMLAVVADSHYPPAARSLRN